MKSKLASLQTLLKRDYDEIISWDNDFFKGSGSALAALNAAYVATWRLGTATAFTHLHCIHRPQHGSRLTFPF
jgi:hypothetical protein